MVPSAQLMVVVPKLWYANRPAFCFSSQKNILTGTASVFTYRVLLTNSCIFVYFPYYFLKMASIISHRFVHVAFASTVFLIVWYLVEWVFLEQGATRWQCRTPPSGTRSEKGWEPLVYGDIYCHRSSSTTATWQLSPHDSLLVFATNVFYDNLQKNVTKDSPAQVQEPSANADAARGLFCMRASSPKYWPFVYRFSSTSSSGLLCEKAITNEKASLIAKASLEHVPRWIAER